MSLHRQFVQFNLYIDSDDGVPVMNELTKSPLQSNVNISEVADDEHDEDEKSYRVKALERSRRELAGNHPK